MQNSQNETEISFKEIFIPFTTKKAIYFIIFTSLVVFFNTLFNGFVWDDNIYIILNPFIHQIDIINAFAPNIFNQESYYRPISAIYFSFLYALFKESPFFYHFFQVSIHTVNVILLFILFKSFINKYLAFILALIFLVHPLQVESVSFIASTNIPLFFTFGISALLLSIKNEINAKRLTIIFGLLLLSCLTRETGLIFLVLVLLYRIIFSKKQKGIFIVFGTVVLLVYFFLRFVIAKAFLAKISIIPIASLSLAERVMNMPSIFFYYINNFFFPNKLAINQMWVIKDINFSSFYFPLVIDLAVLSAIALIGAFLLRKSKEKFSIFLFFLIWFFAGTILIMQIFPLDMTVADRWFYFPMAGLLGLIGIAVQEVKINKQKLNIIMICVIVVLLALSVRTIVRNSNWHDAITLYSHDVMIESNFDTENNLGAELINVGQYENAIIHLNKSIEFYPNEINYTNLGYSYQQLGKKDVALKYYKKALTSNSFNVQPPHKLQYTTYAFPTEFSIQQSEFTTAREILYKAVLDYPTNSRLFVYLAYVEYKLGNSDKALAAASQAYKLEPNDITNHVYSKIKSNLPLDINLNSNQ